MSPHTVQSEQWFKCFNRWKKSQCSHRLKSCMYEMSPSSQHKKSSINKHFSKMSGKMTFYERYLFKKKIHHKLVYQCTLWLTSDPLCLPDEVDYQLFEFYEETKVKFADLSETMLWEYIDSGEPMWVKIFTSLLYSCSVGICFNGGYWKGCVAFWTLRPELFFVFLVFCPLFALSTRQKKQQPTIWTLIKSIKKWKVCSQSHVSVSKFQ